MLESLDSLWHGMALARRLLLGLGAGLLLASVPDAVLAGACERRLQARLRDRHPGQWQRLVAGDGSLRGWLAVRAWLTDGSVLAWPDDALKFGYRRRRRHLRRSGLLAISGGALVAAALSF